MSRRRQWVFAPLLTVLVCTLSLAVPAPATAYWNDVDSTTQPAGGVTATAGTLLPVSGVDATETPTGAITVTWTVPPGEPVGTAYRVTRTAPGAAAVVCTVDSATSCTDTGLVVDGSEYAYDVVAVLPNSSWESTPVSTLSPAPGDLFVTDSGRGRVVEQASGTHVLTSLAGGLISPRAVAVDATGDVYVADDSIEHRILRISADRSTRTSIDTGLEFPSALAVDPGGNVFIADTTLGRIMKIGAIDGRETLVGAPGLSVTAIAVDSAGDVYYTGPSSGVVELPADGGDARTVLASAPHASGLAVSSAGDVFVADAVNGSVTKVLARGGAPTIVANNLTEPHGLALDAQGNLLVADTGHGRVVLIPADGSSPTVVVSGLSHPLGVAVSAPPPRLTVDDGPTRTAALGEPYPSYTFTATSVEGEPSPTWRVRSGELPPGLTLDPTTGVLSGTPAAVGTVTFQVQAANAATGSVFEPVTVAVTPPADVYVAQYSDRGSVARLAQNTDAATTVGKGVGRPVAVAVDAAGDVFVVDDEVGQVVEIPADGGPRVTVMEGLGEYSGLAVDAAGDVFVADFVNRRVLKAVAPDYAARITFDDLSATAVAVGATGDVFVSTGDGIVQLPADGDSPPTTVTEFGVGATALAVNAGGDMFVTFGTDTVVELPVTGGANPVASGLGSVSGLAIDQLGNLLVTDAGTDGGHHGRLLRYPLGGGAPTTMLSGLDNPSAVAVRPSPRVAVDDGASYPDAGVVGAPYRWAAPAANSSPATSFYVTSGDLPPGVQLDPVTGALTGTPTQTGSFTFDEVMSDPGGGGPFEFSRPGVLHRFSVTMGVFRRTAGDLIWATLPSPTITRFDGVIWETPTDGSAPVSIVARLGSPDQPLIPRDVDIDRHGTIYAVLHDQSRVVRIGTDGTRRDIGTDLTAPTAVAVGAAGDVYIADAGNGRVVEVPADGSPQITITAGHGTSDAALAVDAVGDVFTIAADEDHVTAVSADRRTTRRLGSGLRHTNSIVADTDGHLFVVADMAGTNPTKLSIDAGTQSIVADVSGGQGAAVTRSGRLIVCTPPNTIIHIGGQNGTLSAPYNAFRVAVYAP